MVLAARYIRRHWGMALASVLFLTVETLSNLLQPMLMSKIVDDGVARHSIAAVISWGWVMLAVAVAGAIGAVVRSICSSRVAQLVGRDIRSDTYGKVMSLPFESIYQLRPGAIITRITNDVTQIQNFTQGLLRVMLRPPITCIGAIALIIIQIPRQAPIVAIMLVISAVFIATNMSRSFPPLPRGPTGAGPSGNHQPPISALDTRGQSLWSGTPGGRQIRCGGAVVCHCQHPCRTG